MLVPNAWTSVLYTQEGNWRIRSVWIPLESKFCEPLASLVSVDLTQQCTAQNSAQTRQSIQHRASTQQLTVFSSVLTTLLYFVVFLRKFGTQQEGSEV